MERKIVEVTWEDAQSGNYQLSESELKDVAPLICNSIGYLVENNEDRIILGFMMLKKGGHVTEDEFKIHEVIPKGMVKKLR